MTLPSGARRPADLTPADVRWLAWHEAQAHGLVGREIRNLDDAVLLHDPSDREPFWNRIAGLAWPSDADAFDRRLAEALALFAGLDRIPHVWPSPSFDEPADLVDRLRAAGFEDHGRGMLMAFDAPRAEAEVRRLAGRPLPPDTTVERHHGLVGPVAVATAELIAEVLLDAFTVEPERRAGIAGETALAFGHEAFHAIVVRVDGEPAAVARRTTLAGASYLSSIGTLARFRGRGLGRLVTVLATADGLDDGSEVTHLGVFEENAIARRLYESLGFVAVGEPGPDLLLRG